MIGLEFREKNKMLTVSTNNIFDQNLCKSNKEIPM